MRCKYVTRMIMGLMLGFLSQPLTVYGQSSQEKPSQEATQADENFVYPESNFVPQDLKSAVIATPRYPMSNAEPKVITVVERFLYDESKYAPSVIVSRLPEGVSDTSSPEKTMFSRTSAMINGDYDLYASYWDEKSRAFTEQYFRMNKVTPERMVGNWQGSFSQLNMVMLRRIDIGDYVVLVYDLEKKVGGKEKMGMEMPVIFQKEGQDWHATQDLRDDPLVATSPWISGDHKIEVTVR